MIDLTTISCFCGEDNPNYLQLNPLPVQQYQSWLQEQEDFIQSWATGCFEPKNDHYFIVPDITGKPTQILYCYEEHNFCPFKMAATLKKLPTTIPGIRLIDNNPLWNNQNMRDFALAWGMASYRFQAFKDAQTSVPPLYLPTSYPDCSLIEYITSCVYMGRDLINYPAQTLDPIMMKKVMRWLAQSYGAELTIIEGDDLITHNYPLIHAVGRAANTPPHLLDLHWRGSKCHDESPLVVLVGKGVCYDTGGLDLKSSSNMAIMKKDMGGAASALALGRLIMSVDLPIRLRILIPAVENAISSNSYRTGDVYDSRAGLTVEIKNTDAEGRLVLADALTTACENNPDLVITLATLTGAARVALGPDLPPMYSNHDPLAKKVQDIAFDCHDPVWHMPLWQRYADRLKSNIADLQNVSSARDGFAGSIQAALFLQNFVDPEVQWLHFDIYGWNPAGMPAIHPAGGEVMPIRALYQFLEETYG